MVAYDKNNIGAYSPKVTGGVFVAPKGTELPVSVTEQLSSEFVSLGYVTEDGVTEAVSRDVEKKKAWGNQTVKILTTDHTVEYSLSLMETANLAAMKTVYGEDNVEQKADGSVVMLNADELPEQVIVFDMLDKSSKIGKRIVVPAGKVTELGDTTYVHSDTTQFEITIEAMDDEKGNKSYIYTATGDAVAEEEPVTP